MFIKKSNSFLLTCLLAFTMCSIFTANASGQTKIRYVDNSVAMSGDGQSWAGAYKTLWEVLNIANAPLSGDWQIQVAKGTYTPEAQDLPFLINNKPGELAGDRIVLLGGYLGDAENNANPDLRDPIQFPTILSGDLNGDDLDFGSRLDNEDGWFHIKRDENAFTVLEILDSGPGNRVDGFIIEKGAKGTDILGQFYGGGMLSIDSSIDVVNCTFRYNSVGIPDPDPNSPFPPGGTEGIGGGAMVIGSPAGGLEFTRFINCTFHDNLAGQGGGLALVDLSSPQEIRITQAKVLNSLFHDNRAIVMTDTPNFAVAGSGGAIIVYGQDPPVHENLATIEVTNCTVVNNWAERVAGGFYLWNAADQFESVI